MDPRLPDPRLPDPRLPDPRLALGVELPPVPVGSGPLGQALLESWWKLALACVKVGAGVVWVTGGPAASGRAREVAAAATSLTVPLWCDACTIAAGGLAFVDDGVLGVVSGLPGDRHPAVLARDVTTLDVLSGGRAAVVLRWVGTQEPAGSTCDLQAVCTYLGEAVAVCRAVLQDEDPVFEGRYLHIAGAVNRPPPSRTGGLPLLVDVPSGIPEPASRGPGVSYLLRQVAVGATAILCSDDPREIAMWRRLAVDRAGMLMRDGGTGEMPRIFCRTSLEEDGGDTPLAGRGGVATRAGAAHAAGADGIVVRLRGDSPRGKRDGVDAAVVSDASDAERVAERLSSCFDPWRR
ncbi:MAG: LLM class flavin-dependent oxidoreductase [Actinomycetota bacterium]|nr:LLM class flavin-dependent oxidoreductase [Actinomycetota bacterium]